MKKRRMFFISCICLPLYNFIRKTGFLHHPYKKVSDCGDAKKGLWEKQASAEGSFHCTNWFKPPRVNLHGSSSAQG